MDEKRAITGQVEVDIAALGHNEDIEMKPLEIGGTHPALVNGNNIIVENMKPFFFCALLLTNKH